MVDGSASSFNDRSKKKEYRVDFTSEDLSYDKRRPDEVVGWK
jgi:hypothetical protein